MSFLQRAQKSLGAAGSTFVIGLRLKKKFQFNVVVTLSRVSEGSEVVQTPFSYISG